MVQEYDDMIDVGVIDVKQMTPPVPNEEQHVANQVMHDLHKRKVFGIKKYGTPLQPNNGRDALQDAYEEALDLCCYLKQKLMESSSTPPS